MTNDTMLHSAAVGVHNQRPIPSPARDPKKSCTPAYVIQEETVRVDLEHARDDVVQSSCALRLDSNIGSTVTDESFDSICYQAWCEGCFHNDCTGFGSPFGGVRWALVYDRRLKSATESPWSAEAYFRR